MEYTVQFFFKHRVELAIWKQRDGKCSWLTNLGHDSRSAVNTAAIGCPLMVVAARDMPSCNERGRGHTVLLPDGASTDRDGVK
jgi:hypothetical protein